ncbi:MAG: hypothetical protein ACRDNK_08315, partial [Solirubrobacteraceae bacterium]
PAPPAPPASTPADPAPALPPRVEVPEPDSSLAGLRAVPAPAGGESLAEAVAQLRELAATHEDLLLSMRGLLSDYEHALTEARSAPGPAAGPAPGPAAGPAPGAAAGRAGGGGAAGEDVRSLTVAAGPFASTDAVREFKRALTALPGVSGVELRGYEGGNRAIVDVLLSLPRP